jgi:hypothetical protein
MRLLKTNTTTKAYTEEELRQRNEKRRARALVRWERLRQAQEHPEELEAAEEQQREEPIAERSNNTARPAASESRSSSAKGKEKDSGSSSESSEEGEDTPRRIKFVKRKLVQKKRRSSLRSERGHSSTFGVPVVPQPSGAKRLQQLEQANAMNRFFDALGGRES